MKKGRKIRVIAIVILITLLASTEYKTLYEVAMASSLINQKEDTASLEGSDEEATPAQSAYETSEAETIASSEETMTYDTVADATATDETATAEESMADEAVENEALAEATGDVTVSGNVTGDDTTVNDNNANDDENVDTDDINTDDNSGNDIDGNEDDINETATGDTEADAAEADGAEATNADEESTVSENELVEELEQVGENPFGTSEIPTDVTEFEIWYNKKEESDKVAYIRNLQDWLNFQELSQKTSLEGYVFKINENKTSADADGKLYDLTVLSDYTGDAAKYNFTGIGSEEFPFKGTLCCYLSGGLSIKTKVPIFNYLSSGSSVSMLSIICVNSPAGLAAHVVGGGTVNLSNITISGKVLCNYTSSRRSAGALFGEISNDKENALKVQVTKENGIGVSFASYNDDRLTIQGAYAGAIAGYVSGNVELEIDTALYDITKLGDIKGESILNAGSYVYEGSIGCLIGKVAGNETYKPKIILNNTTKDADTIVIVNGTKEIGCNKLNARGSAGALIGHMDYGILDTSGKKVVIAPNNGGEYIVCSNNNGKGGIGGAIGVLENSTIVKNSRFELSNALLRANVGVYGIGGLFGVVKNSDIQACDAVQVTDGTTQTTTTTIPAMFSIANVFVHANTSAPTNGAGGIVGCYQDDEVKNSTISQIEINNIKVKTESATNKSSVGILVGQFVANNNSTLTLSDWNINGFMSTANQGAGAGGAVGTASGDGTGAITIKNGIINTDSNGGFTYNSGTVFLIWETLSKAGGILGTLKAGNCYIENITSESLSLRSDRECGGLVGEIEGSDTQKYLSIENITLRNVYVSNENGGSYDHSYGVKGLLIGKAGKNSMVRLGGSLDFSDTVWYWTDKTGNTYCGHKTFYVGKIAGIQEQAVIYLDTDATYKEYNYVSNGTNDDKKLKYVDEIGNFGGVYRNGAWGESGETLFSGAKINGTVAKSGDSYEIDSVADLMRFAIVMNSEGAFGTECFVDTVTDEESKSQAYTALLSAKYSLKASEYNLTGTGVVSLQRTIGKGSSATITSLTDIPEELTTTPQLFKGSFSGADVANPSKIILSTEFYRRINHGLFANVGSESAETGPAVFANLELEESITQKKANEKDQNIAFNEPGSIGGLSTYAQGNVSVTNCVLTVNLEIEKYIYEVSKKAYHGGLFGKYTAFDGSKFVADKITAKGTKVVHDNDYYLSQMVSCIESPWGTSVLPEIAFSNITISGEIQNKSNYYYQNDADKHSYMGGLIAVMNENKEDGSGNEASWENGEESFHYFTKERTKLDISNLTVSDFTLVNSSVANRSSGLLGFRWLDVNATLSVIVIGETDKPNTLTTYKRFGGLINEVCGRMDVQNAIICNTTINSKNTVEYSSLFVAEATYLYLSVTDYNVLATTAINLSAREFFDEIAGCSKEGRVSETSGGVISISTTDIEKSLLTNEDGAKYHSYENGATYTVAGSGIDAKKIENNGTRYYYDIPAIMSAAGNLEDAIINSPEELMRWHLLQYCRSHLREYFITEDESESSSTVRKQNYQIKGTIDLNGYSYYPTQIDHKSITGTDNATIIFYGQDIINRESENDKRQRQPYDNEKQHHMLHSALFKDICGVTVSNLTLTGTVSEVNGDDSGALVCGKIEGQKVTKDDADDKLGYLYSTQSKDYTNITNITLKNLWVAREDKSESWSGTNSKTEYGLMVASIVEGAKVNFDTIVMTDYDITMSPTDETKAARSLIAVVGENSEVDVTEEDSEIQISFKNMDIADVADSADLESLEYVPDLSNSTQNDTVLNDASLICYFYYYEDSCYAIYTFTKADYLSGKGIEFTENDSDYTNADTIIGSGHVTMGKEIDADTEYIDANIDTKILSDKYKFDNNNYIPYVLEARKVIVNPKPGHITKGCGTYEDPYIIENDKQLKSVYYYLKNQTAQLINWQINVIGDDTNFCSGTHEPANIKTYGKAEDAEDFPTREQLSQAYYLISPATDSEGNYIIDLSTCEDFVGFGSLNEPFVGVIVGDTRGGSAPVIKLPGYVNTDQDVDSIGLVRYAKGCVVKDLTIELGTTKNDTEYYAGIKGAGAGVFGYVCGGDNVIDNVTVKGTLQTGKTTEITENENGTGTVATDVTYTDAQIGGYVGCVDLGTVILRNITNDSLAEFTIKDFKNNAITSGETYMWIGGIIGRVKDGAVVYEGSTNTTSPILKENTVGFAYSNTQGLMASPNYGIVNAAYLKNTNTCGKVEIQLNDDGSLNIQAANSGQLLLTAMALNSGCLTYVGDKESELQYRNGYGADSRCRNGSYENVGSITANTDVNYKDAITYDNLNGAQPDDATFFAPYLYQYFTVSSTSASVINLSTILLETDDSGSLAYNNPKTKSKYITMDANNLTLTLASNATYDMTDDIIGLGSSFRGIGAGYYKENNTFKGNVEGNSSTIKLDIISNKALGIDNIGLFNTVVIDAQSDGCYMGNLTITGSLINADVASRVSSLTDDVLSGDSISGKSAAGLIGRLEIDSDITATNLSTNKYNYSFTNIQVKDINVETQEYAGGIIGRIVSAPEGGVNDTYGNALYFENCIVGENSDNEAVETYNTTIKGRADVGGIIASYQDSIDVTLKNCGVRSVDLQARGMHSYQVLGADETTLVDRCVYPAAGGFIGKGVGNGKTITVTGGQYDKVSLKAKGHMGGAIGETESTLLVNGDGTEDSFSGNAITFLGLGNNSNENTYIEDGKHDSELNEDGSYDTNSASYNRTKYFGSFGGFVGYVSGPGTSLYNIELKEIKGSIKDGKIHKTFMGGLVGRLYETDKTPFIIKNCKVGSEDTNLSLISDGTPTDVDRVSTGGLAGNIECSAVTYVIGCEVIGNWDGTSTLQGTDTAAGMNALVETYVNNGGFNIDICYEDCTVKNISINSRARAGGVEGYRTSKQYINVISRFYNVTVSDCILNIIDTWNTDTVASGGLQAYSKAHAVAVNCNVQNVKMKGKTIHAAGGLVGRADGNDAWIRTANTTVEGCSIVGAYAGGVAGRIDKSGTGNSRTALSSMTVKNNKIISHYGTKGYSQRVGGLYGAWSSRTKYTYITVMGENIDISNNLIAALPVQNQSVGSWIKIGGMMGVTYSDMKIKSVSLENNIVTVLDLNSVNADAMSANLTLEDYLISDNFGIWDENKQVKSTNVESVHPKLYESKNNRFEQYRTFTLEDLEATSTNNYLNYIGLINGMVDGEQQVWVTDVKVSYDDELRVYRPVADVAGTATSSYTHHIVYGQYEDSETSQTEVDSTSIANAMGIDENGYYQFKDLQKIWSDYSKENSDKKYVYRLSQNYQGTQFDAEYSIDDILSGTYYDEGDGGYRSIYKNADGKIIPMLVYDNQSSVDEMVNTAINVLTNNGGCLRETNIKGCTTVTPIKMIVENGVVRQATDTDKTTGNYNCEPSIKVSNGDYSNFALGVNSTGYDEQESEYTGTFTVLHIEYTWSYGDTYNTLTYSSDYNKQFITDQTQTMVLDIPVYIEEVLEYQTHITGVQGAEYYLDNLITNGKSSILTLRDSYTAYVEYDYNASYTKYNSRLHKEIAYKDTGNGNNVNIPKGTRFVLIDVSDNCHAYYYSVQNDSTSVPFSQFTDSGDNRYVEKAISQLTECSKESLSKTLYSAHENESDKSMLSDKYAIQQYILMVDSSEVTDAATNYAYELVVQPDKDDTNNANDVETATLIRRSINKTCPKNCTLKITEYQGISGKFIDEKTGLKGTISQEDNVTINLEYEINAPTSYWDYLNANRASSVSQYLDVAIYLQKDGKRVALPSGTQVTFNKGKSDQAVGVMQGNSILYQYKDAGLTYDLNKLTKNTTISGTIDLDFSSADFTGFENGQYTVIFELLKTKDADFPMGGEVLDTFTANVESEAEKNLGFVLETTDLLALGMNGYLPEESDSGVVNCTMKIDFSDYLNVLGLPSKEMTEMSNKYFTVQFEVQKKVKANDGSLSYENYNGDLVQVYFGESENAWANPVDGSKVVYKFTEDFMKEGYSPDGNKEKSVVSFPYTVVADVDGLLETYDNITNYRVIAKLYLTDNMPSGTKAEKDSSSPEGCEIHILPSVNMSAAAESMKDYFVFTVAKIKTDLDITN